MQQKTTQTMCVDQKTLDIVSAFTGKGGLDHAKRVLPQTMRWFP